MTEVKLTLDTETLKGVVSEAILASLSAEARAAMIQGAIKHLLERPSSTSPYDRNRPSPLEEAFRIAVHDTARKVAAETIAGDDVLQARLRALILDGYEKLLTERRDDVVARIASSISDAMFRDC